MTPAHRDTVQARLRDMRRAIERIERARTPFERQLIPLNIDLARNAAVRAGVRAPDVPATIPTMEMTMSKFTVGDKVEHSRHRWGVGEIVGVVANKYLACMEVRYTVQFPRFPHVLYASDLKAAETVEATVARPAFTPRAVDGPSAA